jgi:dihydrofolate reductase
MRKLIVTNIVSLDGYYERPGGSVMVLPMGQSFDAYNAERLRTADTLLLGRNTYQGFRGFRPQMANNPDATPVHREISRRPRDRVSGAEVPSCPRPGMSEASGSSGSLGRYGEYRGFAGPI